ncbi:transporter substrate-binding domain-containing protein, partial [Proteus mirabilis]
AVRKGNADLQDKLNKALSEVKADGTYDVIYKKWFE